MYEGASDRVYFDVLIPRLMEEIVLSFGTRLSTIPDFPAVVLRRGTVEDVAREACEAKDAMHLCFIHSDIGGRNLELTLDARSVSYCTSMQTLCEWARGVSRLAPEGN